MKTFFLRFAAAIGFAAAALAATEAAAVSFGGVASVTYGPYVRFEIGGSHRSLNDAYWLPPGYPSDPKVTFDLGSGSGTFGGVALGYDWMNGFRGDIELLSRGRMDLSGPWTSPAPGPHADITGGTVRTTALMLNVYYSPLEKKGVNSRVQPFLTAGFGVASNQVGDWTRTNLADADRPVRTFAGDTKTSIALSVGVGVSLQLTKAGQHPVILDASYKYYYFGEARGGATPLPGNGNSEPVQPLTFHPSDQVLSISIRIPLQRL